MNVKDKLKELEHRIELLEQKLEIMGSMQQTTNPIGALIKEMINPEIKEKMQKIISKKYDKILEDDGLGIEFKKDKEKK